MSDLQKTLIIGANQHTSAFLTRMSSDDLKKSFKGTVSILREDSNSYGSNFTHQWGLDHKSLKKIAETPLLGQEGAFRYFLEQTFELRQEQWDIVVNLSHNSWASQLMNVLECKKKMGAQIEEGQTVCKEKELKLINRLSLGHFKDDLTFNFLWRKCLKLALPHNLSLKLHEVLELKKIKGELPYQSTLVGLRWSKEDSWQKDLEIFLGNIFTIVPLSSTVSEYDSFVDFIITDMDQSTEGINLVPIIKVSENYSEDLLIEAMAQKFSHNLEKWMIYHFLFEFVGEERLATMTEKIIAQYPYDVLKDFLYKEVNQLKIVAKTIVSEIRRFNPPFEALDQFYANAHVSLKFTTLLGLQASSHLENKIQTVDDIRNIRTQFRSYNQLLEKVFKKIYLEPIKSDLGLML